MGTVFVSRCFLVPTARARRDVVPSLRWRRDGVSGLFATLPRLCRKIAHTRLADQGFSHRCANSSCTTGVERHERAFRTRNGVVPSRNPPRDPWRAEIRSLAPKRHHGPRNPEPRSPEPRNTGARNRVTQTEPRHHATPKPKRNRRADHPRGWAPRSAEISAAAAIACGAKAAIVSPGCSSAIEEIEMPCVARPV